MVKYSGKAHTDIKRKIVQNVRSDMRAVYPHTYFFERDYSAPQVPQKSKCAGVPP